MGAGSKRCPEPKRKRPHGFRVGEEARMLGGGKGSELTRPLIEKIRELQ